LTFPDRSPSARIVSQGIRASCEDNARSLEENWFSELIFSSGSEVLAQSLELYDFHLAKIQQCDQSIQADLDALQSRADISNDPMPASGHHRKMRKHGPRFDLRQQLYSVTGVDLTQVDGFDVQIAQIIISEIGTDMTP
jgi:transposase